MCTFLRSLTYCSIAAMEVDLPLPVTPANRIRPCELMAMSPSDCGRNSSSNLRMLLVMRRAATAGLPRAMNMLTRKRFLSS